MEATINQEVSAIDKICSEVIDIIKEKFDIKASVNYLNHTIKQWDACSKFIPLDNGGFPGNPSIVVNPRDINTLRMIE